MMNMSFYRPQSPQHQSEHKLLDRKSKRKKSEECIDENFEIKVSKKKGRKPKASTAIVNVADPEPASSS